VRQKLGSSQARVRLAISFLLNFAQQHCLTRATVVKYFLSVLAIFLRISDDLASFSESEFAEDDLSCRIFALHLRQRREGGFGDSSTTPKLSAPIFTKTSTICLSQVTALFSRSSLTLAEKDCRL
jgi:hypothetical protein